MEHIGECECCRSLRQRVVTYSEHMRGARRQYLLLVLELTSWNTRKAARIAGVHRTAFYKLMQKAGIAAPKASRYANRGNEAWRALQ